MISYEPLLIEVIQFECEDDVCNSVTQHEDPPVTTKYELPLIPLP